MKLRSLILAFFFVLIASALQYSYWIEEEISVAVDSIEIICQFIALPLSLKMISDNKRIQFNEGAEFTLPMKIVANNSVEESDIKDQMNAVGLKMIFGIGYRMPLGLSRKVINLDYALGMINIAKDLDDVESLLPRTRYSSLRFSLDWLISSKKYKEKMIKE